MLKLSKRLCTAASYVRDGAVVADIGTDHAYLPVYLALNNQISKAIASDVNEGPIKKAQDNIIKYNLTDKIITCVADGLEGIERYSPTDIAICGMGGELIVQILEKSEYQRIKGIRLILQPMTSAKELREYLQNGYSIIDESVVYEDNKLYQIICVEYDGVIKSYSDVQLELGPKNIENGGEAFEMLLNSAIKKKEKIINGLRLGGYDSKTVENELIELKKLCKGN